MNIRKEEIKDYKAIYAVVRDAFGSAEHADGNEQDLVNALRKGTAYIPELSLVAEENKKIIGHIMFTKARVGENIVLALAPLSVLPEYQRKGIGIALIKEGHRIAQELGYGYSVAEVSIVAITVNIYYSGKGENAKKFAEEMISSGVVDAIRAEEGNLKYEYFFPMENEETVLLIDSWKDQHSIDTHHASPVMEKIIGLREKYDLHMRVERYVSDETGIPEADIAFIKN